MSNKGGKREGAGRPKGSVDKVPKAIKEAILAAFNDPRTGGVEWLVALAQEDKKTFAGLLGRIIPKDVNANLTGDITISTILNEIYGTDQPEEPKTLQ